MTLRRWVIIAALSVSVLLTLCVALALFVLTYPYRPYVNLEQSGSPSYAELCDPKQTTNLTRAQAESFIERLKGTRVNAWKRYVYEVNDNYIFGYQVLLSTDPNLKTTSGWVTTYDKSVLSLAKGQLWTFSGTITAGDTYAGYCTFYLDADN